MTALRDREVQLEALVRELCLTGVGACRRGNPAARRQHLASIERANRFFKMEALKAEEEAERLGINGEDPRPEPPLPNELQEAVHDQPMPAGDQWKATAPYKEDD